MDAIENILTRRSIRKYTEQGVSKEIEELLLKAGMCAPNTIGKRNWAFIVVRERKKLEDITTALAPNAPNLKNAPLAIIVCGDISLTVKGLEGYWVQDCASAATNMLLAAHATGLSGCWYGVYPQENKVRNIVSLFELPDHIIPMCVVSIGYPAEEKSDISEQKYETEKIHYEKW